MGWQVTKPNYFLLMLLRVVGLVKVRREGQHHYYCLVEPLARGLLRLVSA
jgi:hypothetical protein